MKAALPENERLRLQTLRDYAILDTLQEIEFDALAQLAAEICGTPNAFISFIDESRQWLKSAIGTEMKETSREDAFCAHTILNNEILVVSDPQLDPRFADNCFVTMANGVRFYAGAPLKHSNGSNVGTLCVVDQCPRILSEKQLHALESLARQVVAQLELRKQLSEMSVVQTELERAREEAMRAYHVKAEFLANMSHEIRTPLNGILGMTELLLDSATSEEQRQRLTVLKNSGGSLLQLINDILDFSKLEAQKVELEALPFGPGQLIEETVALFAPLANQKAIQLRSIARSNLPAVAGDEHRVRQVLNNLISNALKFTSSGGVVIAAEANALPDGQLEFHISVQDTGIGISAEAQGRLFQQFSQVDAATARKFGGTGLGLSISYALCQLMGGRMWVDSEADVGATFHFTFRGAPAAPVVVPVAQSETREIPHEPQPLEILVAEDNSTNKIVILAYLKKLGYTAEVVENGEQALERAKQKKFDLILMDCHMPIMNGFEATQRILKEAPYVPRIVALTAGARREDRERCLRAGMSDFLSKPLQLRPLRELLERMATEVVASVTAA